MNEQPDPDPAPRPAATPFEAPGPGGEADSREGRELARVDELLEAAAAEPEPLPPGLLDQVERYVGARCRRRRRTWVGGAAAAVILLAAGWVATRVLSTAPNGAAPGGRGDGRSVPAVVRAASPPVRAVSVDAGPGVLAVPISTGNPNVTIVWLYPAIERPEGERRRQ